MIENLLKEEREIISFVKTTWLYSHIQANSVFVTIDDIALPPPYRMIKTRNRELSHNFDKFEGSFSMFLDQNKKYKIQPVRFDDIVYVVNQTTDQICGGIVLRDKNICGLFELMNFLQNSMKGTWSIHSKLLHFSDATDMTLYKMVDFSVLNSGS